MRVVLVLGSRLLASGRMSRMFIRRVERAVSLLSRDMADLLIIAGGATRTGFPTEAEAGLAYVPTEIAGRALIEIRSRSTSENIRYVRELLGDTPITSLIVVASASHIPRVRYLISRLWPEASAAASFEAVGQVTLLERVRECALLALAIIDPANKVFLPILKKWFRREQ